MLKVRLIPTLLFKHFTLVKGVRFDSWRRTGSAMQMMQVYTVRDVDEMAFLDIAATPDKRSPDFNFIDDLADECFVPFSVGGGITTVEDVRQLLRVGADKVVIGTAAVETPRLVEDAARAFGSQCVVVSVDVKLLPDGRYDVYTHSGKNATGIDPVALCLQAERAGAGEILLTSIDRDGTMEGYDIDLIRSVTDTVHIPVIASGGAGTYEHFAQAIQKGNASAVAAASMFHFTEQTPLQAKRYLKERGIPVRI